MKTLQRVGFLMFVILFSVGMLGHNTNAAESNRVIAFLHAEVVPMDRERVLHDHTVVVTEGKIVTIGPSSKVRVPAGALRIDATGRYLIPGLCDMHVHLL